MILLFFFVYAQGKPFVHPHAQTLQIVCHAAVLLTYLAAAVLFYQDVGSSMQPGKYQHAGSVALIVAYGSIPVLLARYTQVAVQAARFADFKALHLRKLVKEIVSSEDADGNLVSQDHQRINGELIKEPLEPPGRMAKSAIEPKFHLFLSHNWVHAQDQCGTIKAGLKSMHINARVFLDVDDLKATSDLETHIKNSDAVLMFVTEGFVGTKKHNGRASACRQEVMFAHKYEKPILVLYETDVLHGREKAGSVNNLMPDKFHDANSVSDYIRDQNIKFLEARVRLLRRKNALMTMQRAGLIHRLRARVHGDEQSARRADEMSAISTTQSSASPANKSLPTLGATPRGHSHAACKRGSAHFDEAAIANVPRRESRALLSQQKGRTCSSLGEGGPEKGTIPRLREVAEIRLGCVAPQRSGWELFTRRESRSRSKSWFGGNLRDLRKNVAQNLTLSKKEMREDEEAELERKREIEEEAVNALRQEVHKAWKMSYEAEPLGLRWRILPSEPEAEKGEKEIKHANLAKELEKKREKSTTGVLMFTRDELRDLKVPELEECHYVKFQKDVSNRSTAASEDDPATRKSSASRTCYFKPELKPPLKSGADGRPSFPAAPFVPGALPTAANRRSCADSEASKSFKSVTILPWYRERHLRERIMNHIAEILFHQQSDKSTNPSSREEDKPAVAAASSASTAASPIRRLGKSMGKRLSTIPSMGKRLSTLAVSPVMAQSKGTIFGSGRLLRGPKKLYVSDAYGEADGKRFVKQIKAAFRGRCDLIWLKSNGGDPKTMELPTLKDDRVCPTLLLLTPAFIRGSKRRSEAEASPDRVLFDHLKAIVSKIRQVHDVQMTFGRSGQTERAEKSRPSKENTLSSLRSLLKSGSHSSAAKSLRRELLLKATLLPFYCPWTPDMRDEHIGETAIPQLPVFAHGFDDYRSAFPDEWTESKLEIQLQLFDKWVMELWLHPVCAEHALKRAEHAETTLRDLGREEELKNAFRRSEHEDFRNAAQETGRRNTMAEV